MKKNNLKYILMCFVVFAGTWHQPAAASITDVTRMNPICKDLNLTISQSKKLAKKYAFMKVKQVGWNDREWKALLTLWTKESRWDYTADNPKSSAYGIPQMHLGLKYIKKRYKTPTLALHHHDRKGWY